MKRWHYLMLILVSLSPRAYAESKCASPNSYQDLIACAELQSPEIQSAQLEVDRSKALIDAASQWQNPELSAETFHGQVDGEHRQETDISLGIPIELGGKLSARKEVAKGGFSLAEAKLYEARSKVRAQFFLKLHRLRQVTHEQEIADEAIQTFSKLIGQYAKRPGLSPEQQIAYSVYQLSRSDYELKRSSTVEEILGLETFFKLHLGLSLDQVRGFLPDSPKAWPKLALPVNAKLSPQQQRFQAELATAKAELSLAQSEAWPTLRIGPSVKRQQEAGQSNDLMGINLSLPIPVFNLNGGARAAAASGFRQNELRREFGLKEQTLRREELQKVYEQAVRVMKESLSHEDIEKRHRDAEKLFTRGIVPSSLVIEAHRTSFDLEKTRHERELRTLETLIEIYTLDGNILEVGL